MKVYVDDVFPDNIDDKDLHKTSTITNYVYSDDGIYIIKKNDIIKLVPNDMPIEKYSFGKLDFYIDKSSYIFRKEVYNIPYNHIIKTIEKDELKHNIKSQISMIIERNNGKISDIFFETREKVLYTELKEDILKYVSLFNNIKQY